MIKRLSILVLCVIPAVAWSQTKPKDITTESRDKDVRKLTNDIDQAFDDSYARCRIRDVLVTNWIYGTDTSQYTGFIGVKPGGSGLHLYGLNENSGSSSAGGLVLHEAAGNGSGYIALVPPNVTTSHQFTLPPAPGVAGTILTSTDGVGGTSWGTAAGVWTGDTLFQHVFDTVIGVSETFTLPIAYTSATSYRVTCTATNDNTAAGDELNYCSGLGTRNDLAIIRVINLSSSTFTVSSIGYMDDASVAVTPSVGDSLTCNCVASGR